MMNSIGFCVCLKIFSRTGKNLLLLLILIVVWGSTGVNNETLSQINSHRQESAKRAEHRIGPVIQGTYAAAAQDTAGESGLALDDSVAGAGPEKVPKPTSVMYKSMIVPGWGQVVNQQVWKVPIVYALIAGVTYYSIHLNQKYNDYKAAYYNAVYPEREPRFGPTPEYINPNINESSLKSIRNDYRNRRDKAFIGIGLAYGLNVIDAYVFAHLRDFDVSDDLSMNVSMDNPGRRSRAQPGSFARLSNYNSIGLSLNFKLITN